MYWFTADCHLDYDNIRISCNRPFNNITDMNNTIVKNWNDNVSKKDTVYILGDFAWHNTGKWLNILKGRKILIKGNHDRKRDLEYFDEVCLLKDIKIDKIKLTLCHYAMMSWNCSCHGAWHLFGHSHGNLKHDGLAMDVGMDCNNFTPVNWNMIKAKIMLKADKLIFKLNDIIGFERIESNYVFLFKKSKTPLKTIIVNPIYGIYSNNDNYEVDIKCDMDNRLYFKYLNRYFYMDNIIWKDNIY